MTPDDELLSAHLDRELRSEDAAQVDGDESVADRLAELARARELLKTPAPLPPQSVRDAAIRAAIDAATDASDSDRNDGVVDLADKRRRMARRTRVLSIAAGATMAVGTLAFLASSTGTSSDGAGTLATASDLEPSPVGVAGVTALGAGEVIALGELGAFSDVAELRGVLDAVEIEEMTTPPRDDTRTPTPAAAEAADAASAADEGDVATAGDGDGSEPTTTAVAGQAGGAAEGRTGASPQTGEAPLAPHSLTESTETQQPSSPTQCRSAAEALTPGGVLIATGVLEWESERAFLYAFALGTDTTTSTDSSGTVDRRVVVVRDPDCALLVDIEL